MFELAVEEPNCSFDPAVYESGSLPRCAVKHRRLIGLTMMGIYLLFANVMLLNILIAMFRYPMLRIYCLPRQINYELRPYKNYLILMTANLTINIVLIMTAMSTIMIFMSNC